MVQALLALSILIAWPTSTFAFGSKRASHPCPEIRIKDESKLGLTDTEVRLLCGDTGDSREARAWRQIPVAQAKANFKAFIQERGYFAPVFRNVPDVKGDEAAEFDPGPLSQVKLLIGTNLPPEVQIRKYRDPIGEPLTPKRVSAVGEWVKKRLREAGYPCPEVTVTATPEAGLITAHWDNPSPQGRISRVIEDASFGLNPGVLRRYDAFKVGQQYSLIRAEITGKRSMSDRLTFSHDFEPQCEGETVALKEMIRSGPARLITVGIGGNTEGVIIGKVSWSHTRLGNNGSMMEFMARGSTREQTVLGRGDWYFSGEHPRQRLSPNVQFAREVERRYELLAVRARTLWRTQAELERGSFNFGIGPGWRNVQQIEGLGPLNSQFFSLEMEATYVSHWFEYYAQSPRQGQRISFSTTYLPADLKDAGRPLRFKLDGTWLFNPGEFDSPRAVLGARASVFYTLLPKGTQMENVPVEFRQWMGGGRDVRGFGRLELPNNQFGSRLSAFLGTEIRFPGYLPAGLEPFLLGDGAWIKTGPETGSEESDIFWSPGFGIRWQSPVGSIRGSLAHGFVVGKPRSDLSHWQFYLSLGEEF